MSWAARQDIDGLGGTTTYLYDAVDNQTGIIDPDGNRTTFVFDALNRETRRPTPSTIASRWPTTLPTA